MGGGGGNVCLPSLTFLLSTMFDELEYTENKLSTMVLMRSLAHTDHVFLVFFSAASSMSCHKHVRMYVLVK